MGLMGVENQPFYGDVKWDISIIMIQLVHNWNIWEYYGNIWVLLSKLRLKKPTAGLTIKNIWNQPMHDGYLDAS